MAPKEEPINSPNAEGAPHGVMGLLQRALDNAGSFRNLQKNEREFLPAALEIIETPVSPTFRMTALVICALAIFALLWSCLAHTDMVAIAPGRVIPLGQVKVIQPLETAAIKTIYVDDGDHVVAGQVLVDLDPAEVQADLESLLYDRGQASLDAEIARLLLTRDKTAEFFAPKEIDLSLAEAGRLQAIAEITRHLSQISGINAELAQKGAMSDANMAAIEKARDTLPLLKEKGDTAKTLFEKNFGLRTPVLDAEQQFIEKKAELASAEAIRRQISAEADAGRAKLDEVTSSFIADASDRRNKALQRISALDQQIVKVKSRQSYKRLLAPVDGTAQNVKIHTPGAVVTTADILMTIVPNGAGVEVEVNIENKDIGFVREGQAVEVKFDAFPFTRYGLVKGNLRRVNRDATQVLPQQQLGAQAQASTPTMQELAYVAKITLERDWISIDSRREQLQPGMRVSAEIKTGNRRVIDYLLSPVVQAVTEAGRER